MSAGSLDDIQDIVDLLHKQDCIFCLVVGRVGEKCSRDWISMKGNYDEESRLKLHQIVETAFVEHKEENT